jgi:hypothetical protein
LSHNKGTSLDTDLRIFNLRIPQNKGARLTGIEPATYGSGVLREIRKKESSQEKIKAKVGICENINNHPFAEILDTAFI